MPASAERQLADLRAIGLDWDGEVVFQSHRHDAYEAALERLLRGRRPVRVLLHARGDPRGRLGAARPAARGRLPRHVPAADRGRAAAQARRRPPAGAAGARRAPRGSTFTDRVHGAQEGVVDDFVVRRNDGAPAYNLAVDRRRRVAGHRRGRARRRPARHHAAPAVPRASGSGSSRRHTRTSRSCSAPTARGWPSATARSRSTSSTPARRCAGWRGRWGWTAPRRPRRCASASTRPRCRARRRAGSRRRAVQVRPSRSRPARTRARARQRRAAVVAGRRAEHRARRARRFGEVLHRARRSATRASPSSAGW